MRKPFNLRPPRFNELMSTSDTDHELLEPLAATLEGWALHDDLNNVLLEIVIDERDQAANEPGGRLDSGSSPGRPKDWNAIRNYIFCLAEFEVTTRFCNKPSGMKRARRARAAGEIQDKYEVSRSQLYKRLKSEATTKKAKKKQKGSPARSKSSAH